MVRNNDGTGSLKIVQSLDYEDQLQSNGFRFRIQVNDKVDKKEFLRGKIILNNYNSLFFKFFPLINLSKYF